MGVFKKYGKYWIDYYCNGTRTRKPISKNKSEAEKVLIKIKSDILHRRYAIPKNEKIRFAEFAKEYIQKHSVPFKRSWKTDLVLLKNLIPYFGDMWIDEITSFSFEQYRQKRVREKVKNKTKLTSTTTINREGELLRSILNRAVNWGFLSFNQMGKLERFKEEPKERILTEKEILKLVANATPPLKHVILVALNTGMRKAEILNLKWDNVNLDTGLISVIKTKSRRMRHIPLNGALIDLFSRMQLKRNGREFVFENPDTGKPFMEIKTAWHTLLKKSGISNFRFHDLRHCFATYSLLRGGDIISLKETLGHSSINTTSRYTKSLLEGMRKLVVGFEIKENQTEIIPLSEMKVASN